MELNLSRARHPDAQGVSVHTTAADFARRVLPATTSVTERVGGQRLRHARCCCRHSGRSAGSVRNTGSNVRWVWTDGSLDATGGGTDRVAGRLQCSAVRRWLSKDQPVNVTASLPEDGPVVPAPCVAVTTGHCRSATTSKRHSWLSRKVDWLHARTAVRHHYWYRRHYGSLATRTGLLRSSIVIVATIIRSFSMEELFKTVDVRNVLGFIKETHFYNQL